MALPAFIASRVDARSAVASLINDLFNDDFGDLFVSTFDAGLNRAIHALKSRLADKFATEIDTCIKECRERLHRNDLNLIIVRGDHFISPVAFLDPEEEGDLVTKLQQVAVRVHRVMGCRDFSQIDCR